MHNNAKATAVQGHTWGYRLHIHMATSRSGAAWRAGSVVLACLEYTCVIVI